MYALVPGAKIATMCQHAAALSLRAGMGAAQPVSATVVEIKDVAPVPELTATLYHGCAAPVRKPSAKCLGPVLERRIEKDTEVGVKPAVLTQNSQPAVAFAKEVVKPANENAEPVTPAGNDTVAGTPT